MTVRRAPTPRPRAVAGLPREAGLPARLAAIEILVRVEQEGGFADVLLGARLPDFPPADRRLITRLVLGTLAWRGRLDHELTHLTGRSLSAIQPPALAILRMGLLQLRFLDRIPQHAVVDTAVSIGKQLPEARKAAGFINAVMRRATRETAAMPPREADEAGHLAVAYSHPRWLVERFIAWFGVADAERLMAADNEAAPNVIRLNLALASRAEILERLNGEGFELGAGGRALETIVLKSAAKLESPAYREGLFHAQAEASQLVARMLGPRRDATVVDCAAAPGGKTTHLAELAGAGGRVIALDINFAGLRNTRALARRLRHRNIELVRADAANAIPLRPATFDYVLLDAPCTGLGTLREHPEIRWRLRPDDPARMAVLQVKMLERAAEIVGPGGAIVYSVCSLAPEEGAGVVEAFLSAHREFAVDRQPPNLEEIKDLLDEHGYLKTRPDQGGLDGFFAARMVRR